jgi:hypothetical protein
MVSVKRYLWLIHLVLIAAGVYIGSDLFWAIVGSRIEPGSRLPIGLPRPLQKRRKTRPGQYAVIQERNLFGARNRTATPSPPRLPAPLQHLSNRRSI